MLECRELTMVSECGLDSVGPNSCSSSTLAASSACSLSERESHHTPNSWVYSTPIPLKEDNFYGIICQGRRPLETQAAWMDVIYRTMKRKASISDDEATIRELRKSPEFAA